LLGAVEGHCLRNELQAVFTEFTKSRQRQRGEENVVGVHELCLPDLLPLPPCSVPPVELSPRLGASIVAKGMFRNK